MRIERRYTKAGQSAYADIEFRLTTSEIRNPDGSTVFKCENVEVPAAWSQVAADVLAQKYFRKAGVPARLKKVEEPTVPSWLWHSAPDQAALAQLPEKERDVGEHSAKQVFDRLAGTWTYWGWKGGYFDSESDAQSFFDEIRYMLAMQMAAPNSPQWFNTGLHWAYGIDGPSQGHFYVDYVTGKLTKSKSAYEHPQPHACFIQGIKDDLVNEGGIMDLWVREARLFKYGSGTGSNFSNLRGEGERLARRRQVFRPDELPQDRRPRGRRHQIGRHHAARRQDGDRRHRPSRHRAVHRLEGEGGAEGRQPGHRLQDQPEAPARNPQSLRELRRLRRRLLRSGQEPGAAARDQGGAQDLCSRQLHPPRHPVRQAGLHRHQLPGLRHRLGLGGLSHGLRTELQQFGARHRRIPQGGRVGCRLGSVLAHQAGQDRQDPEGARPVGEDRPRRLGLRRSRPAISHHGQRLAHLPGVGPDPRLQSVLGIHVPGRHRLQSRVHEPARLPRRQDAAVRSRRLRARHPAVDRGAGNLGADGPVPLQGNRPALL